MRTFLVCLFLASSCLASHFRGGSISFRPLRRTGALVYGQFQTHFSWRRGYGSMTSCDQATVDRQALFGPILDITCEVGCDTPSQVIGNTSIICTSFSVQDDWSFGQNSFGYVLKPDTYYEVTFIGGYWVELVLQGTSVRPSGWPLSALSAACNCQVCVSKGRISNWEIRTKFSTFARADSDNLNTSPSTLVPPVISLRHGFVHKVNIPSIDLDYDDVRCRWARAHANECSGEPDSDHGACCHLL